MDRVREMIGTVPRMLGVMPEGLNKAAHRRFLWGMTDDKHGVPCFSPQNRGHGCEKV